MIYANIATLPERRDIYFQMYESIKNQVDLVVTYYGIVSETNMGDGMKFYKTKDEDGYIFTCDDDLIYPPDYVQTMIEHIERYERKAIITLHGRTFPKHRPIYSYYRDKLAGYHWNNNQPFDIQVDSGGTGVMCWRSDTIKINYEDIKHPNMADVWMAVFARRANVPIICVNHKSDWLKYIGPDETDKNPQTIWSKHHNDDRLQTEIYNKG